MNVQQVTYLVFGLVLVVALILDLGLLSKKSSSISIKKALWQTIFWVSLAVGFFFFLWFNNTVDVQGVDRHVVALEYLSAYLMEWSLSIDNIFVFILIFAFFGIKEQYYARVLLIGILMAIVLRIAFIAVGIELIQRFHWLLYAFGVILLYTGIKMYSTKHDDEVDLDKNRVYKLLKRILPITNEEAEGKFLVRIGKKRYYTRMFVVIIMLASTDIIFALDSIPAVFAISQNPLVIYTSNIFAVLGLRSLFFLLRGAVNKFGYLQQGIALVLIFIGLKMLVEIFHIELPVYISLAVILFTIVGSIMISILKTKNLPKDQDQTRAI
jgi:tellurite resistance protein TerC